MIFEVGPQHALNYRQEIILPLFTRIQAAESCSVVGAASMGKTRLLDFIMRPDVQEHYLGRQTEETLLLRVDCNRISRPPGALIGSSGYPGGKEHPSGKGNPLTAWGLYELMLTAIVEGCDQHPRAHKYLSTFNNDLREPVILKENALLALRHLELAVRMLVRQAGLKLSFLLDEFDPLYANLDAQELANLRALRDANKNRLCYVLFMRNAPEFVRPARDAESFYELFSRSPLGLGPYTPNDAMQALNQLESRRRQAVPEQLKTAITAISGGHPGLFQALLDAIAANPQLPLFPAMAGQLATIPVIAEECLKLWESLPTDEQHGLVNCGLNIEMLSAVRSRLELKGLIKNGVVFSPLFAAYVEEAGRSLAGQVWVNESVHTVQVENKLVTNLSPLEFKLLQHLYHNLGHVCRRDEILECLYSDQEAQAANADNRLEALMHRLREAVEPDPANPRYLLNVRGVGYRLVASPE